jgi:putative transposase
MMFSFVAKHRGIWPVSLICEALGVSRNGFYAWLTRSPSKRAQRDDMLAGEVRKSFLDSDRTYRARRVWRDVLAAGLDCGLHAVERLMQLNALKARPRRRRLLSDTGIRPVTELAANILDRQFHAPAPNRRWVADFTYIWTLQGWLYLAIVVDLFSRKIVGWAMSDRMKRGLAMDALQRAITLRRPAPGLIHHSDRGSQYCSGDYRRLVEASGFIASMSGRGNCYDNAMVETVFKTIKSELVWRTAFASREQASKVIGLYIEGFYNPRRRHSSLGYKSPAAFETAFQAKARTEQIALY